MTLIAKEAQGLGSNGNQDIHSIKPESLSQRTPVYIGGYKEIKLAEKYLK